MHLSENSMLYSIEIDPIFAAYATKIIEWAGLSHKVKVLIGTVDTRINWLKE